MDVPALHTDVTDSILRGAVAVHKGLGPALPEHSYQKALRLEFDAARLEFLDDRPIAVRFKNEIVGPCSV